MYYLIEKFGLLPGWLLASAAIFLRYALFAGLAFVLFYGLRKKAFSPNRIQEKFPKAAHIFSEIRHSAYTALIFALMGVGLYFLKEAGYTRIYTDVGTYGWGILFFSFFLLVGIHDTYFYWVHRLMHHPRLFRTFHRVHHLSHNPTPWASLSFHPLEAAVEVAVIPLAALVIPFHPGVLLVLATWSLAWNIIGHLGYELFPEGFVHHPFFRWFNTSTHHNMHHRLSGCNYGLYFNCWDTWMGTNHPEYQRNFDRITRRKEEGGSRNGAESVKYLIAFFIVSCFGITAAQSQSPSEYGTPEERAARMTDRMQEGLSLNPVQVDTIYILNLKYARRIQREAIDTGMNKLSAYFRIRSINKEKECELFPLLDSAQKERYEAMKAEATRELLARFF